MHSIKRHNLVSQFNYEHMGKNQFYWIVYYFSLKVTFFCIVHVIKIDCIFCSRKNSFTTLRSLKKMIRKREKPLIINDLLFHHLTKSHFLRKSNCIRNLNIIHRRKKNTSHVALFFFISVSIYLKLICFSFREFNSICCAFNAQNVFTKWI